jgi:hypothetical protein
MLTSFPCDLAAAVYLQPPEANTIALFGRGANGSKLVTRYTRRTAPLHSTHVLLCPYVGVSKRLLEKARSQPQIAWPYVSWPYRR